MQTALLLLLLGSTADVDLTVTARTRQGATLSSMAEMIHFVCRGDACYLTQVRLGGCNAAGIGPDFFIPSVWSYSTMAGTLKVTRTGPYVTAEAKSEWGITTTFTFGFGAHRALATFHGEAKGRVGADRITFQYVRASNELFRFDCAMSGL